ncbi:MAG: short-chain dehydrogenase [Ignavibacteria bacterium GWF2_33_9]|nr:MAG: short-chain dehydrogenase [Ignavibacteria bacterium GWF2_33_9]
MSQKNIDSVIAPPPIHWVGNGFRVHNFIPGDSRLPMQRMTPFVLLDYNSEYEFPASDTPRGVGVHPHRGFETVTIAYKGKVEHHDSNGGGGIIGEGDVQWMTAASGILHKEYHEKKWSKNGGIFQMVQLWVNLPARDKMSDPKYQAITKEEMGKVELQNSFGFIEVIAGEYNSVRGPASTFTPINMMNAHLKKGGNADFNFPGNYNTALLVIKGSILVNNSEEVQTDNFVLFENSGEDFTIQANEDSIVLVLSGEPIHEPIAAYGPFVMNTKQELIRAYEDFNSGKFGYLED